MFPFLPRLKTVTPYGTLLELLADYLPRYPWQCHSATESQLALLRSFDMPSIPGLTKGQANHLIRKVQGRQSPTISDRLFLRDLGLWRDGMTQIEALRAISEHFRNQKSK